MSDDRADRARLLFVISNDYGELSNALDLIRGQDFRASLLLPPRLAGSNAGPLPVPWAEYRGPADILDAVDRDRPDVVFLFSAYLYGVNNLLGIEQVNGLIVALQSRGLAIVTSDPFLGLMDRPSLGVFAAGHPLGPVLVEHFNRLGPILAGLVRLYFMPAEEVSGDRKIWARNPRAFDLGETREGPWLYLLSAEDQSHQVARLGREEFDRLLLSLLRDAVQQGRRATLLGPPACLDRLIGPASAIDGVELRSFLGHDEFRSVLLGAERVFYWNIFSNSILARVATRRPVTCFAPGHMVHAIPPLLEAGIRHYYPGGPPPILDPRLIPSAEALASADRAWEPAREVAIRRYSAMPGPSATIRTILGDRPAEG